LVSIDAVNYAYDNEGGKSQYRPSSIIRECNKAFVGFRAVEAIMGESDEVEEDREGYNNWIVTGHWGCGAFKGEKALKAIVQLLAAAAAGRKGLIYCTFGEEEFASRLERFYNDVIVDQDVSVGDLFCSLLVAVSGRPRNDIFAAVRDVISVNRRVCSRDVQFLKTL